MDTERCSRCGNEIPDWAHGVCPVCVRIARDETRYGKHSRSKSHRSRRSLEHVRSTDSAPTPSTVTLPKLPRPKVSLEASSNQASRELRRRWEGINDLLKDTYGAKMLISQVLVERGVPGRTVARWRKDNAWLARFLKRLQPELNEAWAGLLSEQDLVILRRWYGLGETRIRSLQAIADELGMTLAATEVRYRKVQRFLRGRTGRMTLERAIMAAVGQGTL